MRSPEEIRNRLRDWQGARAQFFPDPHFVAVFVSFEEYLNSFVGKNTTAEGNDAAFRERFQRKVADLDSAGSYLTNLNKARDYVSNRLSEENDWITGRSDNGALKGVVWDLLLLELHDAECAMKWQGPDIVLEGKGNPPDFVHPGRTFRFVLRFSNAQFKDERSSKSPIQVIWLLYGWIENDRFIFEAQDDTLSGTMTFSGNDYEYRMWDHVTSREGQTPSA